MPPARRITSRTLLNVLAGALIAAFFLQSFLSSLIKSPSYDEPAHIAAGLSYVQKRVFIPNTQHPPLLKEMAGASLLLAGIRLPDSQGVKEMMQEVPGSQIDWMVGNDLIAKGGTRKVMFWARLPLIILSTSLGLFLYLWGRQILGDIAAIGALFLFALDPNLIAHSEFVTTDMGLAVFMMLFFFSLWNWMQRPSLARLLWCGVAMGLLLCAKFSAIFMIPVALFLMLVEALFPLRAEGEGAGKRLLQALYYFAVMSVVAALVIMVIYVSPRGLQDYVYGLRSVYADANPNFLAYMADELQPRFYGYFAVGWFLKEPLTTVALSILGSVVLIYSRKFSLLNKLFLFLPPLVLFVACTFWAANLGIRYLIPAFPFACLAGGAGLALLIQSGSMWLRGLAAVLCIWIVVAAAGIYPDHLSYFNEAACLLEDPGKLGFDGGTRCGPWWLDDSNTDWGQGLEQLRTWRNAHPDTRAIQMAYFGSFPVLNYGIVARAPARGDIDGDPSPGLYIISVKYLSRLPLSWVRTIPPTAIVGHVFYIYDIRSTPRSN